MKVLGLITARGGSKGIPRKNLQPLAGRPLIAWTVEAAKAAKGLARIVLSTDDDEIASVCRGLGVDVPFMRPPTLAQDRSPHIDVVEHALASLETLDRFRPEYVLLLQPTSPLRRASDIEDALALATERRPNAVVSVAEAKTHPFLTKRLDENGCLVPFVESSLAYPRRQDLPPAYALNGAIFLNATKSLLRDRVFVPPGTVPLIMSRERSLDIDEPRDLRLAELIPRGSF